jgi:hypothetical protein
LNIFFKKFLKIFAPSHGAHSCAKILFAAGEKDERAKMAANEFSRAAPLLTFPEFRVTLYIGYMKIQIT